MSIQEFFNTCPDSFTPEGYCLFRWSQKGCGFGELAFYENDGKLMIMNEGMSKEWIKAFVCKAIDDATLEG